MDKISSRIVRLFGRRPAAETLFVDTLSLRDYADLPPYHPATERGSDEQAEGQLHRRVDARR